MNIRICIGLAILLSTIGYQSIAQRLVPSDGRFNFNIRSDVKGLEFITRLNPVTFQFDLKKFERKLQNSNVSTAVFDFREEHVRRLRRTGFIAQEVALAAEESGFNFSGILKPASDKELYNLNYEAFVVPLVKAVQEQQELINDQQHLMILQKKKLESMEKEIKLLSEKLDQLLEVLEEKAKE